MTLNETKNSQRYQRHDAAATLDLATGTTPSGALKQDDGVTQVNERPDTAPIHLALPTNSALAFVTLRVAACLS